MNYLKYFLATFILVIIQVLSSVSLENNIAVKVDNEIITTMDISNEIKYLKSLNPSLKDLEKEKIFIIGKNSLIREKIKKNELLKHLDEIKLPQNEIKQIKKNMYSKIGLNNEIEFKNYLTNSGIKIKMIENKLSIEALWNELIYAKFSPNLKIDKIKLKEEAKKIVNRKIKKYSLSEIVFRISNKSKLNEKSLKINESILSSGFDNTALFYSVADSSGVGGKLGWIEENGLPKSIRKILSNFKKGQHTDPIFTSSGYLIVKINDIKYEKQNTNIDKIFNDLIKFNTNQQLNQYSNNYFKKIKKNVEINEF